MPPKRKAAQRDVAKVKEIALPVVDNNEVTSVANGKETETPEDKPAQTGAKKDPVKRQKKQVDGPEGSNDERDKNNEPVDRDTEGPNKENLGDDLALTSSYSHVTTRRGHKRAGFNQPIEKLEKIEPSGETDAVITENEPEHELELPKKRRAKGIFNQAEKIEQPGETEAAVTENEPEHELGKSKKRGGRGKINQVESGETEGVVTENGSEHELGEPKKRRGKGQMNQVEKIVQYGDTEAVNTENEPEHEPEVPKKRGGRGKINQVKKIEQSGETEAVVTENEPEHELEEPKKRRGRGKINQVEKIEQPGETETAGTENEPEHKPEEPKKRRGRGKVNQVEKSGDTEAVNTENEPEHEPEEPKKRRGRGKIAQVEKSGETDAVVTDNQPEHELEEPKKRRGRGKINQVEKIEQSGDTEAVNTENEPELPKKRRGRGKIAQDEDLKNLGETKDEEAAVTETEPDHETDAPRKRRGKGKITQAAKDAPVDAKSDNGPEDKIAKIDDSETVFECEKENENGQKWNLKIATWNVAGMRAWVKKNGMDYVKKEDADIICFQETKCPESKVPAEAKLEGYHTFWASGSKDGYAGVSLYSKEKPLKVTYGIGNEEHDVEGRVITAEYEKFYLVTSYVPNAGQGLKTHPKRMAWDVLFRKYLKDLDEKKPVILCGDLNVAHTEIDLANPKTNTKSAGFTPEERENMTLLLKEGFVDSFRKLYPEQTGAYTFWTYLGNARSKNTGWRLDYFIVSERLMSSVCDVVIRNKVMGSDHCPMTLFIHI